MIPEDGFGHRRLMGGGDSKCMGRQPSFVLSVLPMLWRSVRRAILIFTLAYKTFGKIEYRIAESFMLSEKPDVAEFADGLVLMTELSAPVCAAKFMTCSLPNTSRQSDKEEREEYNRGRRSPRLIGSFSATRYSIPGQVYDRATSSSLSDVDVSPLPSLRVTINPPELRNQCVRLALYTVAESYVRNIVLAREQLCGDVQRGRVTGKDDDDRNSDRALKEEDFFLPAWPKKNLEKINGSCFGEALAEGAYYRTVDGDSADARTSLTILPLKAWAYGSYPAAGLSLLIRRVLLQTTCAVAVGVRKHINDRRRGAYYGVKDRATQSNKNVMNIVLTSFLSK
ncbi:hypothetical protein FOZ63_014746 [Perkinsus olseni]|uniref:Uncharacterized protein n=1 Tax=Perkinsus olseni TaxID=32597 RepID=A0A7J6RQ05_PEROL|nr:hypothetical protein FOZ62_020800 [Perkinsus olseni]KAF4759355.1 hypothetical protein FOZ63_014746 [Perkinsus olseni]